MAYNEYFYKFAATKDLLIKESKVLASEKQTLETKNKQLKNVTRLYATIAIIETIILVLVIIK